MSTPLKCLGYVWAFPVTIFGLTYSSLFQFLGWYDWHGVEGDALVWVVNTSRSPRWLKHIWRNWGGHAIGNVVVLRVGPEFKPLILKHEQKHVDQVMRLGLFQPVAYLISSLAIKVGCPGSDAYYTNPFEIDARRHAGQIVDVEGCINKYNEKIKKE